MCRSRFFFEVFQEGERFFVINYHGGAGGLSLSAISKHECLLVSDSLVVASNLAGESIGEGYCFGSSPFARGQF